VAQHFGIVRSGWGATGDPFRAGQTW
jgi:hypothetical protein